MHLHANSNSEFFSLFFRRMRIHIIQLPQALPHPHPQRTFTNGEHTRRPRLSKMRRTNPRSPAIGTPPGSWWPSMSYMNGTSTRRWMRAPRWQRNSACELLLCFE